jgi:high-affinity Fe2+/Pb2+ permease
LPTEKAGHQHHCEDLSIRFLATTSWGPFNPQSASEVRLQRAGDLRRFFQYTGLLLILFAAGLFAKGLHEFRELLGIEWGLVSDTVWNVTSGPFAEGATMHDFIKGLFGWSPNPERIRVVGYLAYLVPVAWFFSRDPTPKRSSADIGEHSPVEVS